MRDTWWYVWNFLSGAGGGLLILGGMKMCIFFLEKISKYFPEA